KSISGLGPGSFSYDPQELIWFFLFAPDSASPGRQAFHRLSLGWPGCDRPPRDSSTPQDFADRVVGLHSSARWRRPLGLLSNTIFPTKFARWHSWDAHRRRVPALHVRPRTPGRRDQLQPESLLRHKARAASSAGSLWRSLLARHALLPPHSRRTNLSAPARCMRRRCPAPVPSLSAIPPWLHRVGRVLPVTSHVQRPDAQISVNVLAPVPPPSNQCRCSHCPCTLRRC